MFLSRFWGNARRRKEGQEFRSLEVRGKLIALKNIKIGKSDLFKSLEIAESLFIPISLSNTLCLLIKRSQFKLKKH